MDAKKISINGVELEFDVYDLETAEKLDVAAKLVMSESEKSKNESESGDLTLAEAIKTQCAAVRNYFDTLFGAGTSDKLFGNRMNLREHLNIFGEAVKAIDAQKEEITTILPLPNRATRRSNAKKK